MNRSDRSSARNSRRRRRRRRDRSSSDNQTNYREGQRDVRRRTGYFYRHDALNISELYDLGHAFMITFMTALVSQMWALLYGIFAVQRYLFLHSALRIRRDFAPTLLLLNEAACFFCLWSH